MDKTVEQLYIDAIALVKEATGLALVIRGDENAPQPKGEYASLLLVSQEQQGLDAIVFSEIPDETEYFGFEGNPTSTAFNTEPFTPDTPVANDEVSALVSGDIHYVFSLQIFRGTQPAERARKLYRFPVSPWGAEWLANRSIVMRSISDPTNTNYEVGQSWVKRCSQQLILAASSEEARNVGVINEVSVVVNKDETYKVNR